MLLLLFVASVAAGAIGLPCAIDFSPDSPSVRLPCEPECRVHRSGACPCNQPAGTNSTRSNTDNNSNHTNNNTDSNNNNDTKNNNTNSTRNKNKNEQ